jgi:hypothetical protein
MASEWAAVDVLIRDLGAVRSAAYAARASEASKVAIQQAIDEATQAILVTIEAPLDGEAFVRARSALEVAEAVIATLDEEIERARRLRARAIALTGRAKELVEQARKRR